MAWNNRRKGDGRRRNTVEADRARLTEEIGGRPPLPYPGSPDIHIPEPREPELMTRAYELLRFVGDLEGEVIFLRSAMFAEGADNPAADHPKRTCIADMVADACSRVANLVGEMRTVNGRIEERPATN